MTQSLTQTSNYDIGLRSFMLSVYNRIGLGLLLTALMAWVAAYTPLRDLLFSGSGKTFHYTALGWIVAFGPIFLLIGLNMARSLAEDAGAAGLAFWGTAGLFGLSFGSIFLRYSGVSIAVTFVETAAAFGALSLYGYVTKHDLRGWGIFLFIALIGLIVSMLASIFIHSTGFNLVINLIGILIFAGFTAYDTQKLKDYYEADSEKVSGLAYMAALNLYLDFINLFVLLLNLSNNKDD